MNSFFKTTLKFLFVVVYVFAIGCASQRSVEDEEFSVSDTDSTSSDVSLDDFESDSSSSSSSDSSSSDSSSQASDSSSSSEKDEFAELENESAPAEQQQQQAQTESQQAPEQAKNEDEAALEEELNKIGQDEQQQQAQQQQPQDQQQQPAQNDELTLDEPKDQQQQALQDQQQTPQEQQQLPEQVIAEQQPQQEPPPPEVVATTPEATVTPVPEEKPVEITGLKYKANDNGGTIVIEANGPIQYTSRKNEQLNQVIIEVNNVILPTKFMRTLNTKDMVGSIGAIDAYQNKDSKIARFVVQMRGPGKDLAIQQEGNSLLVVGEGIVAPALADGTTPAPEGAAPTDGAIPAPEMAANSNEESLTEEGAQEPLQAKSLEEFLTTHQNFTGKKISIEMQAPVIEVIKLIMDESGANIIIDDSVATVGNDKITFKLREIPWDQALVTVLKMKGLAYSRVGNVLRITRQQDLELEQKKLDDLRASRSYADFKVRMFPLSYAKLEDMQKSIADLLSKEDPITKERGKSILDPNTNSIIVTDSESVLEKVAKVIKVLDVAPAQVSIETRIVEASESFQRTLGVRWGFSGNPTEISTNQQGSAVNLTPNFRSSPTFQSPLATLGFNIGTLDLFGSLDASLSLGEQEDMAKVVASPRVVTLNNQAATIGASSKISYTTTQASQGTGGIIQNPTVAVVEVPLSLQVKPIVSNDGFIKMDVNFTKTTVAALKANAPPDTEERKITNQVIVKDGQTMVIGGVFNSTENNSADGVPGLKDVPVLGALFRGKSTVKKKNELLIFITPKILSKFNLKGTSEPYVN